MNRLSMIKNYFNAKEKRIKISNLEIVSKNSSKSAVKALALMLSVVTLFSEIVPSANAAVVKEETKSENSVVRKIKDAGEHVGSLAKNGYTKTINWIKKHPKIVTAITTGVLLTIVAVVGGVYYKSLKKNSDEAELKEKVKKLNPNVGVSTENLLKKSQMPNKEMSPEQMESLLKKLKEQREINVNGYAGDLEKLSKDMKVLVDKRGKSWFTDNTTTEKISSCREFIDGLVEDLRNGRLKGNISEYFGGKCSEYVDVLNGCRRGSSDSKRLACELKSLYESLETSYEVLQSDNRLIDELSQKIQSGNEIGESK